MKIEQFYREATSTEIEWYSTQLYPLQDQVLDVATVFGDALYLTGGTALARYHFQHRLSEDLDFFTQGSPLVPMANELLARLHEHGLSVETEQMTTWFVRFYVIRQDVRLKVDMVRDTRLTGALEPLPGGGYMNGLADIGANKITAFEDRAEMKDIVDLYYICQEQDLELLFSLADYKRVPVAYEQLLTINQQGISGYALLTKPIPEAELVNFIEKLQATAESEVKKKENLANQEIDQVIRSLLWDFPQEERRISKHSRPILERRLATLSLPRRRALASALKNREMGHGTQGAPHG